MNPEIGSILHGRYEILGVVAQGGVSTVYEARDLLLGGTLALKRLLFVNEETRSAFVQEARLLAGLSHHGFPKVIDLFDEDGEDYLVMEFIPGPELEAVARERGRPLSFREIAGWADQILESLEYLHSCNPPIIHRDIKPSNLKLTPHGRIYLIDFGLAKRYDRSHSRPGYTESYAPLEQLRRQGTDQASDIYSLAATFYRLLSGRVPESALVRLEARLREAPDPLRPIDEINRTVPASFARALDAALSLEREHRLGSAEQLRSALNTAMTEAVGSDFPAPDTRAESASAADEGDPRLSGEPTHIDAVDAGPKAADLGFRRTGDLVSKLSPELSAQLSAELSPESSSDSSSDSSDELSPELSPELSGELSDESSSESVDAAREAYAEAEGAEAYAASEFPEFPESSESSESVYAEPDIPAPGAPAPRSGLTAGLQHRVKETVQIPRPEPADVLSLGVLPELGEHTARLAESLQVLIERAPSFRDASRRRLVRGVPMGDGVVLIFMEQGDLALRVAMEAARGWRLDPTLDDFGLRMGLVGAILPRESSTEADARAAQPEIARAREVMRIAGADQILLPVDRMDSLRRLSGTAKGLVLLGERVLGDQSRIQLCSWHFRPPAADGPPAPSQSDPADNYRSAGPLAAPVEKTTPIVSAPSVVTSRITPVPAPPVQPVQSVTPVYHDAPATLRNEDLFAPVPGAASPVVWADSDEEADASEAEKGRGKKSGRGRFLLFLAFLLFAAAIAAGWYYYQAGESEPALPPVRMEFAQIRAGTFMMGADDREPDERPEHQVTLTRNFEIGKYEVTQSQWKQVMDGANPSRFKGDDLPVTNVSWQDAVSFVERLTERMKDQYVYRLPTEAEWEYCARSGTAEQESANLDFLAVYGQTEGGPRAVGRGTANSWAIYDMFGNVFEWCSDNYSARTYENSPVENPEGPATADPDTGRVIRGGGWRSKADRCRPGYRGYFPPDRSNDETGLRVVRVKR